MQNNPRNRLLAGLALGVLSGGCALTPTPKTTELIGQIRSSDGYFQSQTSNRERLDVEAWWLDIGGDELNQLVETLRHDSLILREARLQVEQAREATRIARGQRLPSITAFNEIAGVRSQGFDGEFSFSDVYTSSLFFDFNTDVFGGLRASERAAKLTALATEFSYLAAEQFEIALLVRNWVSAATIKRSLALAEDNAESFRSTYELTNQRYTAGSTTSSASDVQIALQNLETALVDIPQLEADLATQLMLIDQQLARLPGKTTEVFVGALEAFEPVDTPVGLPAELLASRPDVAAAELVYLAALEDVGAARASLYPAIAVSASLTFQADNPGDLFDWEEHISNLAGALTAPIFQGGRLKAQVRLERAQAEELATAFARTALDAVTGVEVALNQIAGLEAQRMQLEAALETAKLSNTIAQGRYQQGLTSILSVLETQRSQNAAAQNLILTDQALANARIDLFLSLGGDWTGEAAVSEPADNS